MILPVLFYVCIVTSDRTDLPLVSVQSESHFTYYLLLCFASIIFYLRGNLDKLGLPWSRRETEAAQGHQNCSTLPVSGELQSWGLRGKRCMVIEKNQLWTSAGREPCHLFLSADSQSHSKVWFSPQPRPIETVALTVSQVIEWKGKDLWAHIANVGGQTTAQGHLGQVYRWQTSCK